MRRARVAGIGLVVVGLLALAPGPASERGPGVPCSYVVSLVRQEVDLAGLAADHGLVLRRGLPALRAAVLADPEGRAPAPVLAGLRRDPRVRAGSLDHELGLAADDCCPSAWTPLELEEALGEARRRLARELGPLRRLASGRQAPIVAVLDTGCDARHPDLAGALLPGVSLVPGAPWDEDANGHGTAMASLVAGRGAGSLGVEGVAPAARVLPVRVCDGAGRAPVSLVAAGIVAALDRGAEVILLSLGSRRAAPVLQDAVRLAEERGALVVAAAGNASVNLDLHPAALDEVLSVGSVEDDGRLAWATALSPTTDVLAAGVDVPVALPGRRHGVASGTSVAAAKLAGVAALVRELAPGWAPGQVRALLRLSTAPLRELAEQPDAARALPAGVLAASELAAALERPASALRLVDPRLLPALAAPGEPVLASVRVENRGLVASPPGEVLVAFGQAGLARLSLPALPPLESVLLRARVVAPGPGLIAFRMGEEEVRCALGAAAAPSGELAIGSARGAVGPDGELSLRATVEGRGSRAAAGTVEARLGDAPLGIASVPPLAAGETAEVLFELEAARAAALPRFAQVRLALVGQQAGATIDLSLGQGEATTQYQQSDELNLIADAPFRLEPGRAWLPVLVFEPEKGSLNPGHWVELERTTITSRATPVAQPGVPDLLVYDDALGGPTVAPPGLVVLDEEGQPVLLAGAPDPRLFQHQRLSTPGRYNLLRLPRAALGLSSPQTAAEDRWLEVTFRWRHRRPALLGAVTRTGQRRWVLKVTFGVDPRPQLGGGQYYDAHCHTIAEWYQSDQFQPLAPKRNFCGPLPMLKEAAHAVGLTDAVDAAWGRVVTTDHNAALNPGDSVQERPSHGPTSVASSAGLSEWDRYRQLFGQTAGEEITLESWGSSSVGSLTIPTPGESHLLSFRGEHALGPYHGNSALAQLLQGQTFPRQRIEDVLQRLARQNRAENRLAAVFPAHPFGGDWSDAMFRTAFEQDPARRADLPVHAERTGFVTKGLQLWNSDGKRRRLDSSLIDWDDLNPWADAAWQRGRPDWDEQVQDGLGRWHAEFLAPLLEYELAGTPGVRFPRKVFMVGGNDAHGDFNYQTSRKATIIRQQSSFEVTARAFGRVATYALPELQPPGAGPLERAFEAFLDGNSVVTDGPLLSLSIDAEDRFHGGDLAWHDARRAAEDADGRIGGGGDFDGLGTALVPRGSAHVRLRHRWVNTAEMGGDLRGVALHRSSPGDPNPVALRASGKPYLQPRGWLVPGAPGQDHEEAIDPAEEGLITAPSALQAAGFTAPDPAALGADDRRCYTNPVWCVPFEATVAVLQSTVDARGVGWIPPGGLSVRFEFDMSLDPRSYRVELKALDASGESSGRGTPPLDVLVPAGPWAPRGAVKDARWELVNAAPIRLGQPRWPGPDRVTFVIYFAEPPCDPFGNPLNRIAVTFETQAVGPPPPPSGSGGGSVAPPGTGSGTTAPGATPGGAGPLPPPGGGGSGGCSLGGRQDPAGLAALIALLALVLAARAATS